MFAMMEEIRGNLQGFRFAAWAKRKRCNPFFLSYTVPCIVTYFSRDADWLSSVVSALTVPSELRTHFELPGVFPARYDTPLTLKASSVFPPVPLVRGER